MKGDISVNKEVRRAHYDRGLKYGNKVLHGSDLRDLVGLTVSDVNSNADDAEVVVWFESNERNVAVYLMDDCLDGQHIAIIDHANEEEESKLLLRPVTENDIKEFSSMVLYYTDDVFGENDEKTGVRYVYCNNLELEESEFFKVKSLYVFQDGRILTER